MRGISFKEIFFHIGNDDELDIYPHPNQERYSRSAVYVVVVNDHAYLDPYVELEGNISLEIIIPSCEATRKHIGKYIMSKYN